MILTSDLFKQKKWLVQSAKTSNFDEKSIANNNILLDIFLDTEKNSIKTKKLDLVLWTVASIFLQDLKHFLFFSTKFIAQCVFYSKFDIGVRLVKIFNSTQKSLNQMGKRLGHFFNQKFYVIFSLQFKSIKI